MESVIKRRVVALIFALFAAPVLAMSAAAHTSVVSTSPLYKSTLDELPAEISIEFTDTLMVLGDEEVNTISVTGPSSAVVNVEKLSIAKNVLTATIADQDYGDGTYIVSYRVVSADGHSISGSYELYLNQPSTVVTSPMLITQMEHQSFLHIHQGHIIWAGVVFIAIALWAGYRRFAREQGE